MRARCSIISAGKVQIEGSHVNLHQRRRVRLRLNSQISDLDIAFGSP